MNNTKLKTFKPLTRPRFFKWLRSLQKNHVMDVYSTCNCPIAQFVKNNGIFNSISVGGKYSGFSVNDNHDERYRIPGWCSDLIYGVDNPHVEPSKVPRQSVTGSFLLNRAKKMKLVA